MKIQEILKSKRTLSYEFYPPKDAEGVSSLLKTIGLLKVFRPDYISVTYGAGGSTRMLTEDVVVRAKQEAGLLSMAHLTCVGQTKDEIHGVLQRLESAGIENVIALRGDPPRGETSFVPVDGGFSHAESLIEYIRNNFNFGIAGACYPETHSESPSLKADMDYTKRKIDAGAGFLITQLFYDNDYFFDFLDKARGAGIDVPILAGVLPILSTTQVRRFTGLCGATIPAELDKRLERFADDDQGARELGIEHATEQVRELWDSGVDGIHFYALNRMYSIAKILENVDYLEPSHRPLV